MRILFCNFLICILLNLMTLTSQSYATPLIALREANNCGGCHKPGRSQRPFFQRRCTLDCQGCHIDPAGGGPRNQWGYYYSQAEAPTFPLIQPIDPLQDTSRFDLHYDGRVIQRYAKNGTRTFPMSSEFSLRIRPIVEYIHLTYQNMLLGRIDDKLFRILREGDRRFREKYSLMIDALPMNIYVRAYRGQPMYGLRRSNHSLWIRERIGLDQFATTDAFEVGGTPNVPFFRMSQMQGDPYVADEWKQKGTSYHGGMRGVSFGWHVNASGWNTSSKNSSIKMNAVGAGANIFGLILYGEKNSRTVQISDEVRINASPSRIHPSSEITEYTVAFAGPKGVMSGIVLENYSDSTSKSQRRNFFIDLHPIPFLQLEFWRRFETGSRSLSDTLAIAHLMADF